MAGFTSFVAGKGNAARCDLSKGGSAIMSILPKALRHHGGPQHDERNHRYQHYDGKSDEVLDVLEQIHAPRQAVPRLPTC